MTTFLTNREKTAQIFQAQRGQGRGTGEKKKAKKFLSAKGAGWGDWGDEPTNEQTKERTNKRTNERTNEQSYDKRQTNERTGYLPMLMSKYG